MVEPLRIDTQLVNAAGERLQTVAESLPEPPTSYRPTGSDYLARAIADKIAEVVDPALAQLPIAKDNMAAYAANVISAAGAYEATDRRLADEILRRVAEFEKLFGGGTDGSSGATGSVSTGSGGSIASAVSTAGSGGQPAAASGQFGQMMQMPMQMAQQAGQIPAQAAGVAASIPQTMMQGVQSALQQAGQFSEEKPEDQETKEDGASPGNASGERVPEVATEQKQGPQKSNDGPEILL